MKNVDEKAPSSPKFSSYTNRSFSQPADLEFRDLKNGIQTYYASMGRRRENYLRWFQQNFNRHDQSRQRTEKDIKICLISYKNEMYGQKYYEQLKQFITLISKILENKNFIFAFV